MKRTWRLTSVSPELDIDVPILGGSLVIGSAAAADIVIKHQTVSRRHARVTVSAAGITIEDLGSTNGVVFDGEKITEPLFLSDHTEFKLGGIRLALAPDAQKRPPYVQESSSLSSGESVLLGPNQRS